jgi:uncharacterized protein YeaO (DUF488 family)
MDTIRFEQIQFATEKNDAFVVAKERLQQITRLFTKNTLLQLLCMDEYMKNIELYVAIRDQANHSPRFLDELNDHFGVIEELQNDEKLGEIQERLKVVILEMNKKNK